MPSMCVSFTSTYTPHSVRPETVPSNSSPMRSFMNSTILYLIEARSASEATISRSEAWAQSFSSSSLSADLPPSR